MTENETVELCAKYPASSRRCFRQNLDPLTLPAGVQGQKSDALRHLWGPHLHQCALLGAHSTRRGLLCPSWTISHTRFPQLCQTDSMGTGSGIPGFDPRHIHLCAAFSSHFPATAADKEEGRSLPLVRYCCLVSRSRSACVFKHTDLEPAASWPVCWPRSTASNCGSTLRT